MSDAENRKKRNERVLTELVLGIICIEMIEADLVMKATKDEVKESLKLLNYKRGCDKSLITSPFFIRLVVEPSVSILFEKIRLRESLRWLRQITHSLKDSLLSR